MSDLIDRQQAIDAILHITNCKSVRELFEYNQAHHLTEMWSGGVNDAIDAVIGVESATDINVGTTDTISRQAAIDAVTDELDMIDHVPQWVFDRLEKRLKQLPPAQPESNYDEWCTNCKEYDKEKHSCPRWNKVIKNTVDELKSAQPEPCEDDPRADVYYLAEKIGIHQLYALVVRLRGEPEPCEDAVSRKAVKDGFVEMCNLICPYTEKQRHAMCGSCLLGTAFDVLEATQSVTPKQRTGHWHITDAYPHNVYCSECHKRFAQTHWAVWKDGSLPRNFCPNCGAKMTKGDAE